MYLERMHGTMNLENLCHDIHRGPEHLRQHHEKHALIPQPECLPSGLPCTAGSSCSRRSIFSRPLSICRYRPWFCLNQFILPEFIAIWLRWQGCIRMILILIMMIPVEKNAGVGERWGRPGWRHDFYALWSKRGTQTKRDEKKRKENETETMQRKEKTALVEAEGKESEFMREKMRMTEWSHWARDCDCDWGRN